MLLNKRTGWHLCTKSTDALQLFIAVIHMWQVTACKQVIYETATSWCNRRASVTCGPVALTSGLVSMCKKVQLLLFKTEQELYQFFVILGWIDALIIKLSPVTAVTCGCCHPRQLSPATAVTCGSYHPWQLSPMTAIASASYQAT